MIITQTPYRVSFAGGGTDLPAFYEREAGAVLSVAVNHHMYVTVSPRFERTTRIAYTRVEICETIGPHLKEMGLIFVGIDVIDGRLTEINVTSPTGIRAIKKFGGPDLAVEIWDVIETKVGR